MALINAVLLFLLTGIVLTGQTVSVIYDFSTSHWHFSSAILPPPVKCPVIPYLQVNGGAWQQTSAIAVTAGSIVNLGPQPLIGTWAWTGPGGFTSSQREMDGVPLNPGVNTFVSRYTDASSCTSTVNFTISVTAAVAGFYAANNGNDSWSGTLPSPNAASTDGPFQTLSKAQAVIRSSGNKTITLRAGTYSSGMSFTAADNGESWIAYPGETVVIDGGGSGTFGFTNPNHMVFRGLTFRNMGPDGFSINYGDSFTVQSNTFSGCTNSCFLANFLTNSVIDSNVVDGQSPGNPAGNNGNGYAAISFMGTSSNNKVTQNRITNAQGGGIAFGNGPTQAGCSNNIIDRNVLRNVDSNAFDFGAIYIYDPSHMGSGNQITSNIVDGYGGPNAVANQVKGIYLDDETSNVIVSGNTVRNGGAWAIMVHGGDHNTFTNNILDLSFPGSLLGFFQVSPIKDYGMVGNVFTKNLVYSSDGFPSSLYQIYVSPGDASLAASGNLYFSATGASVPNNGYMDSNRILANPLFGSPSSGDYSMPAGSPAYVLAGFVPMQTNMIIRRQQ